MTAGSQHLAPPVAKARRGFRGRITMLARWPSQPMAATALSASCLLPLSCPPLRPPSLPSRPRKDSIVAALTKEDAAWAMTPVRSAGRFQERGALTVWRYAARKAKDGELEHAPLARISVQAPRQFARRVLILWHAASGDACRMRSHRHRISAAFGRRELFPLDGYKPSYSIDLIGFFLA
jgi:hypothetical protein